MVFAIHSHQSAMVVHVSPILNPLPPPFPSHFSGLPSVPALSALSHASNLDWRYISHMVIYVFQYYSPKSSHPLLLPQSPKVCSLHLCLFCCLSYRVIIIIFLNSIYMLFCIKDFYISLLFVNLCLASFSRVKFIVWFLSFKR